METGKNATYGVEHSAKERLESLSKEAFCDLYLKI